MSITLNSLDTKSAAENYKSSGFALLPDAISEEDGNRLIEPLATAGPWAFVEGGNAERERTVVPADRLKMMTGRRSRELNAEIYERAADGGQYAFSACPVLPETPEGHAERAELTELLQSDAMATLLADVTGIKGLAPRHAETILMSHNQFVTRGARMEGKPEVLVLLDLTRTWRNEWGAVTLIHDEAGTITDAFGPRFKQLVVMNAAKPWSWTSISMFTRMKRFALLASFAKA